MEGQKPACLFGELCRLVCPAGVWDQRRALHLDRGFPRGLAHVVEVAGRVHAVRLQLLAQKTLWRQAGAQFIRAYVELDGKLVHQLLEAREADVAPRADVVGDEANA